jgi:predicted DNA-binding transcriptional regulator AlpA
MREQSVQTRAVVTVSEMARMVGLSRSRFYQLVEAGVFPQRRLHARVANLDVEELQQVCLDVRRRNCGVNNQPVLFYARGHRLTPQAKPTRSAKPKPKPSKVNDHADLIDGLAALGLPTTTGEVEAAMTALYPTGINGTDRGEVLRAVFLFMKRQNTGGSAGR